MTTASRRSNPNVQQKAPNAAPEVVEPLAAALQLEDPQERSRALLDAINAAPVHFQFPDDLLPQVLSFDPSYGVRGEVIRTLVRRLRPEQIEAALPSITDQSNEKVWVGDLEALAPWLPSSALAPALAIAEQIEYEAARWRALVAISPALTPELRQQALAAAQTLADPSNRIAAVTGILDRAPEAASAELLTAMTSWPAQIEHPESRARSMAEVASTLARCGQAAQGARSLEEASNLLEELPDQGKLFVSILSLAARGDVAEAQGNHRAAIASYQEAIKVAENRGQSHHAADILPRLGHAHKMAGADAEAIAAFSRAAKAFEGDVYRETDARRELWKLHRRSGDWNAADAEERIVRSLGREIAPRADFDLSRNFTPDLPTDKDELGFAPLADSLAAMLNDPRTHLPLTIALTAPWGGGKSSLMQQLESRLRGKTRTAAAGAQPGPRWLAVRFDVWKFPESEQIWASLAKEIYKQGQKDFTFWQKVLFRARLEWKRGKLQLDFFFTVVMIAVGTLLGIALAGAGGSSQAPAAGALTGLLGTVLLFLVSHGKDLANPFQRAIDRHQSRQQAYDSALGVTAEACEDIEALVKTLAPDRSTAIAILVDDLDRCSSSNVVAVVETINQIFNSNPDRRCAFILGIDRDVIVASLEHEYEGLVKSLEKHNRKLAKRFGENFLEKIVQITVAIPPANLDGLYQLLSSVTGNPWKRPDAVNEKAVEEAVLLFRAEPLLNPVDVHDRLAAVERQAPTTSPVDMREAMRRVRTSLLNADSKDVARAEFELLEHLPRNPRTVKRFDNAFRLQLLAANNSPGCELDFRYEEIVALGRWIVIRFGWPDLADTIDRNPDVLGKLEEYANGVAGTTAPALSEWTADAALMKLLKVDRPDARVSRLPFRSFVNIR
jgi:tetratricopeptide (TPR) repeat protein